jgi:hypothetical protein
MRQGRVVGEEEPTQENHERLVSLIVGSADGQVEDGNTEDGNTEDGNTEDGSAEPKNGARDEGRRGE